MPPQTNPKSADARGMQRIMVVGAASSGKSTLARSVSEHLKMPHVEFDGLFWNPGWKYAPHEEVRERLEVATSGRNWILDGNFLEYREIVWPRADTVVWLDYPMGLVLWWAIRRTISRCWTREVLWSKNVESFQRAFLCRDSFLLWAAEGWRQRRRDYAKILSRPESSHLHVVKLRSLQETQAWFQLLPPIGDDRPRKITPMPDRPYKRAG